MKNFNYLLLSLLLLFSFCAKAQYCTPDTRFTEAQYFTNSEITTVTNLVYGNAKDYQGNPQDLLIDIWYPSGANETFSKRPFILLIHGGGFISGNKDAMGVECRSFAQRGYVAATMSYRLGWDDSDP
ncbi:MAG: carboxylesterase family protein [Saprospiraceae bacterium]|nr:carboxylesterase family protein [Saprospiraceae bacterium]